MTVSNEICYVRLVYRKASLAAYKAYLHFSVNHGDPSGAMELLNLIVAFVRHTMFGHIPHALLGEYLCTRIACLYSAFTCFQIAINRNWASFKSLGYIALKAESPCAVRVSAVHVSESR